MKAFFRTFLACLIALLLAGVIMLFVMLGAITSAIGGGGKDVVTEIKPKTVLQIDLDKAIAEQAQAPSLVNFNLNPLAGGMPESSMGLNDLVKAVKAAKEDPDIEGIFLNYDGGVAGLATWETFRNVLKDFKESGKFIYAYGDNYGQGAYYLCSVADSVFMQPQGGVSFQGLAANIMFYPKFFEKVGVKMQVIRHGQFKSAVEPYMLTKMSDANRLQYTVLFNSIWGVMIDDMSASRGICPKRLNEIADSLLGFTAIGALNAGLVDVLVPSTDMKEVYLHSRLGLDSADKVNTVGLDAYCSNIKAKKNKAKDKIAVIYAEGEIGVGEGGNGSIGTGIADEIAKAAKDKNVKAIVLRVNSPGGAVITADIIYQEILKAKAKMPVIASFGDYAASGGYYISCPCDRIFAEPNTLTGSIGVFGTIPSAEGLIQGKLGFTFDCVQTNKNATALKGITRDMTQYEKDIMLLSIEQIYDNFIGIVAKGRGMTKEQVDEIGQGRVWSGTNGKEIGLVDELGSLDDAIACAVEKAGVTDYRIVEYPRAKSMREQIMDMAKDVKADPMEKALAQFGPEAAHAYRALMQVAKAEGAQSWARMPEIFVVK